MSMINVFTSIDLLAAYWKCDSDSSSYQIRSMDISEASHINRKFKLKHHSDLSRPYLLSNLIDKWFREELRFDWISKKLFHCTDQNNFTSRATTLSSVSVRMEKLKFEWILSVNNHSKNFYCFLVTDYALRPPWLTLIVD